MGGRAQAAAVARAGGVKSVLQSPVNVTSGTACYWLARNLPLTVPSHDIKHENTMSMAFVALKV